MKLTIATSDPHHYSIALQTEDPQDKDRRPGMVAVHAVKVDGEPLLNIESLQEDGSGGEWTLARYRVFRPGLVDFMLIDPVEAFDGSPTPAQRLEIVKRGLKKPGLFEDFVTCVRIEEKPASD